MTLVVIRGVDVDLRYVILNCVWDVTLIFVWLAVAVTTKRMYSRLTRYDAPTEAYESHLTRWSHIFAIAVLCTLYGIDTMNVYFDSILYLNVILMEEYCIIATSWVIYYLLSHVHTYLILHSKIRLPEGLVTLRVYWMRFVLIVGNILVIVVATLQRAFLEGLVFQFLAVQHMILGPLLAIVVFTVSRQWKTLYAEASPQSGKLREAARSFQRLGYVSSGFIMFFGAALTYFYSQDFAVSKDLRFQDLPGFGNRRGADEFSLRNAWPRWFALVALLYLLKLHWIAKRQPISTDRGKTPPLDPAARRKRSGTPLGDVELHALPTSKFAEEARRGSSSRASLHDFRYQSSSLSTTPSGLSIPMNKIPTCEKCTFDPQLCSLRSLPEEDGDTPETHKSSLSGNTPQDITPPCCGEVDVQVQSVSTLVIEEKTMTHSSREESSSQKNSSSITTDESAAENYAVEHVEIDTASRDNSRVHHGSCSRSLTSSTSSVSPPRSEAHIV